MKAPLLFYDLVESTVHVQKDDEDGLGEGRRGGG
jgi:hypothetical protein